MCSGLKVVPEALEIQQRQRVGACGHPISVLRESGREDAAHWWCNQRYCEQCAKAKARRVYAVIRDRLEEYGDSVVLLTLTQRPAQKGTGADALSACWDSVADHWSRTYDLLQKHDRHHHKVEEWSEQIAAADTVKRWEGCRKWLEYHQEERRKVVPALETQCEEYTRTYDSEKGWKTDGELTLCWVREVTAGQADEVSGRHQHWHVHQHVICPDMATALRVNAAWQATRRQADYCQTDVQDSEAPPAKAAQYVAKYTTKAGEELPEYMHAGWVQGMKHRRLYDAAGRWRPLGVAPTPSEDPAIAIGIDWPELGTVYETFDEFYEIDSKVRGIIVASGHLDGEGQDWAALGGAGELDRITALLEQHTNFSEVLLAAYRQEQGCETSNEGRNGTISGRPAAPY